MKAAGSDFYASAASYVDGSEAMQNEVTMLYVAAAVVMQELARKHLARSPYGGLGAEVGSRCRDAFGATTVLDVCCGPGNMANHLGAVVPRLEVTGVDKSELFIEAARRRFEGLPWELRVGDARTLDLGKRFDFVTGGSAYHHIEDEHKVAFLQGLARHLSPGGRIVLCENFLPPYADAGQRQQAIDRYYTELKAWFVAGGGTKEAVDAIGEVHQLERAGEEEHKVSFAVFELHVRAAGLRVDRKIGVWQPEALAGAGSYVVSLAPTS